MKICSKCNRENEDSARFCDFCGTPMEEQTAYQAPTPQTVTPVFEKTPPAFETGTEKPKKKLNKKVLLLLIGLLSVGGITVLIGALTNWFGLGSPLNGLFKAFAKTAEAESLTINVKMKVGDEKGDASARYVLDPEKESVSLLAEIDAGNRSQKFALYKGDAIQVSTSKDMDFDSYSYADINEDVLDEEEFFEQLEEFKENAEDPDWDELVENAGLSDYVDSDEIQAFLEEFFKEKLSDSDWLETYLGFEKDGSTYSFEPELRDLADEMGDILIDSDVLSRDARKAVKEFLADLEDFDDLDEIKVRIAFTVKRGYISEIDFALQLESGEKIRVEIEITDPNKTRISTSELKKVRNAAEDLIEENTCRECGELLFYYDEGDHGDCKECGAHGYIGYNGNVCWDCDRKPDYSYAGYGYCCNCRSYEEVYYSHYNKKMCEDCVEDDYYYSSNYGYCYNCGDYEYLYSSGKCYYCY